MKYSNILINSYNNSSNFDYDIYDKCLDSGDDYSYSRQPMKSKRPKKSKWY